MERGLGCLVAGPRAAGLDQIATVGPDRDAVSGRSGDSGGVDPRTEDQRAGGNRETVQRLHQRTVDRNEGGRRVDDENLLLRDLRV